MTAEVAVMNKMAVALASDSAVTVAGAPQPKIFTTANKVFALSKHRPVGIMVHGGSEFMGVPWETVIKTYRSQAGSTSYPNLQQYADAFLSFLESESSIVSAARERSYFTAELGEYFAEIKKAAEEKAQQAKLESLDALKQVVNEWTANWAAHQFWPSIPENHPVTLRDAFSDVLADVTDAYFSELSLDDATREQLASLGTTLFCKIDMRGDWSGVVVGGFGDDEVFPSVYANQIDARLCGKLKAQELKSMRGVVDVDRNAFILPFAQSDMVVAFMRGIDPRYRHAIKGFVEQTLSRLPGHVTEALPGVDEKTRAQIQDVLRDTSEGLQEALVGLLDDYEREQFIQPVLAAVAQLPKDELAAMAETFVTLTAFKHRVTSSELESVGGPVDVAVISKGDGFVWIKRKHYFDPALNPTLPRRTCNASKGRTLNPC